MSRDAAGPSVWDRERSLARTTVFWGLASAAVGIGIAAATDDPARRSFGLQTAGWGAVDLGIAVVARRLQDARMQRLPDRYAPAAQEAERRLLLRVLAVNTVADVGYCVMGAVLARDPRPRVAGSGVAIVVQGAFLALHDGFHTVGAARRSGHWATARDDDE